MGMEGGRHQGEQESGSETPARSENHGEAVAMEHEDGSPVKKKERERHHRHHSHHGHHGKNREKDRSSREKKEKRSSKEKHSSSSRVKRRSLDDMATGTVSLSVAQSSLPLSSSSDDDESEHGVRVRRPADVDQEVGVRAIAEEADRELGEIEEGEIREEGEVQCEGFMDVQVADCTVEEKITSSSKKRKYSPAVQELYAKHTRSKVSSESLLLETEGVALAADDEDVQQAGAADDRKISRSRKSSHSHRSSRRHKDELSEGDESSRRSRSRDRDATKKSKEIDPVKPSLKSESLDPKRRSVSRDNLDRKRRSRSRESTRTKKHDESLDVKYPAKPKDEHGHKEPNKHDRSRRSKSRDSLRDGKVDEEASRRKRGERHESRRREERVRSRADSKDRRPRSKSRESARGVKIEENLDRKGRAGRDGSVERRRRSRSRESLRDHKVEEILDKKGHSGSRESGRERNGEDRDGRRNFGRLDDSLNRDRRSDHESGRSGRADSSERRKRSRSRESLLERRGGSRPRGYGDDYQDRNVRLGGRAYDGRNHYDGQDGRNGNLHNAGRDRSYGADRHGDRDWDRGRDGGYGNHHTRDRGDRSYQSRSSRDDAKHEKEEKAREEEDQEEYQERIESQLAAEEEDDVDRIREESRRRRQAILEKYKQQQESKVDVEKPAAANEVENSTGPGEVRNHPTSLFENKDEEAVNGTSVNLEKGNLLSGNAKEEPGGLGQGSPKSERPADMFCDDIFGESPAGGRRVGKGDGLAIDTSGLTDNWDDAEGRYCFRIGEILEGRYEVLSSHGSGVFSTVVRARDMKAGRNDPEEVAIKIIRNNETMFRTGQQELVILKKLAGADPENRRHCVRLLSSFEYRNHLCLVFESLHMNLREILKKFGRNIGINLTAVRAYAKQLFIALKHLRNCGVLHCDIKPDNMLVNDAKNMLKLCDFGSAMFAGENEITPYLVSRFYRAPEIILGLPYDHALDVWSVGCCLYELYSGKMLFPGHTNNDMLRLHMELKGPFPKKMLKKANFTDQHFDQDYNFCAVEEDPVTKKMVKRIIVNVKPKDMGVLVASSGTVDEDLRIVGQFKDMLEKIFILDPDKRMTVSQALNHPFISGK